MADLTNTIRILFETAGEGKVRQAVKGIQAATNRMKANRSFTQISQQGDLITKNIYRQVAGTNAWNKSIQVTQSSLAKFNFGWLSTMFYAMRIQRLFSSLFSSMIQTFRTMAAKTNPLNMALIRLEASWTFLKYSIIEALSPLFTRIIIWFAELAMIIAQLDPEVIIAIGLALATILGLAWVTFEVSQFNLLVQGIQKLSAINYGAWVPWIAAIAASLAMIAAVSGRVKELWEDFPEAKEIFDDSGVLDHMGESFKTLVNNIWSLITGWKIFGETSKEEAAGITAALIDLSVVLGTVVYALAQAVKLAEILVRINPLWIPFKTSWDTSVSDMSFVDSIVGQWEGLKEAGQDFSDTADNMWDLLSQLTTPEGVMEQMAEKNQMITQTSEEVAQTMAERSIPTYDHLAATLNEDVIPAVDNLTSSIELIPSYKKSTIHIHTIYTSSGGGTSEQTVKPVEAIV